MAGSRGRAGRRRDGARQLFCPGVVDLQLRAARLGASDDGALIERPDDGVVGRGDCREADEVLLGDGELAADAAFPVERPGEVQEGGADGGGGDDPASVGVVGLLEAVRGEAQGGVDGEFVAGWTMLSESFATSSSSSRLSGNWLRWARCPSAAAGAMGSVAAASSASSAPSASRRVVPPPPPRVVRIRASIRPSEFGCATPAPAGINLPRRLPQPPHPRTPPHSCLRRNDVRGAA